MTYISLWTLKFTEKPPMTNEDMFVQMVGLVPSSAQALSALVVCSSRVLYFSSNNFWPFFGYFWEIPATPIPKTNSPHISGGVAMTSLIYVTVDLKPMYTQPKPSTSINDNVYNHHQRQAGPLHCPST
ncbi:hypothetical protein M413DRAFT_442054 [Hebeloma cylindrosporum]|uniref:Uncharacterized protein n=1 Tax=Hebeloma cylindrosporum TaxID=76867 RepID=A0A0C3CMN4_HEBCY|nr:hypothetical protein M413DRAFT_442054 [Hebeloma cylindrosporum h7]